MLHAIASAFVGVAAFISSLFGVAPAQSSDLGAALPSGVAGFETSLQSRISSTDTSLSLVANSVRGGSSLSGYNCFTVDEGRTDAEYICGTVSGTSVTSLTRGVDPTTGTSSNSALKFAHRVGANVKITDFPLLQILRNQANGSDTYPNPLRYTAGVAPSTADDLTDKGYVDTLAFSGAGIVDASAVAKGVVELATGAEAAASTASGSSGTLALPASLGTSTYNSATAPNRVVVTGGTGKIDNYFIATSTLFAATSSLSVGAFPAWQIGKQVAVITSTGTTSWPVPSGITKISVEVCGPGGGGGSGAVNVGAGGGAGGYAFESVDVTGTTSIQVYVGPGGAGAIAGNNSGTSGTWSTFGTNGFYLSATGGVGGGGNGSGGTGSGGSAAGGTGVGGDLNITGGPGSYISTSFAGLGGTGHCGGGGVGAVGGNYGGGGAGNGANAAGYAGAPGVVIIRW